MPKIRHYVPRQAGGVPRRFAAGDVPRRFATDDVPRRFAADDVPRRFAADVMHSRRSDGGLALPVICNSSCASAGYADSGQSRSLLPDSIGECVS
jgi:hypothetical protein